MRTLIKRSVLVCVFAAAMAAAAEAKGVVITITGTVTSGKNGSANLPKARGPFGANNQDLAGLPFVLTYFIDESKGTGVLFGPRCSSSGPFAASQISSVGPSNPIVATLAINGGVFAFGGGPYDENDKSYSSALRLASSCNPNSRLIAGVTISNGFNGSRYSGGSYVNVTLSPGAKASLTNDPDLGAPLYIEVPVVNPKLSILAFAITINDRLVGAAPITATGHLSVDSVRIE